MVVWSIVSLPNHTFTGQALSSKQLTSIVHILSPETDNCPSWISRREKGENDCRKYFMINLHEKMLGSLLGRGGKGGGGQTCNLLITSRTCIQLNHWGRLYVVFCLFVCLFFSKVNQVIYSSYPINSPSFRTSFKQFFRYLAHKISLCLIGSQCMNGKRGSETTSLTEKWKKNIGPLIFHPYSIYKISRPFSTICNCDTDKWTKNPKGICPLKLLQSWGTIKVKEKNHLYFVTHPDHHLRWCHSLPCIQ